MVNMDLCEQCGDEVETVGHCFHNCWFAMQDWMSSSIFMVINSMPVTNCLEWVCNLMAQYGMELVNLFITICWCL